MPSLKQLVDAVSTFMDEHPNDLVTVVVDATFGHRIDPRETAEFDAAIEHNEIVAPPAGAVGRGDAFVLAIADKVNATIISNDSYQEFHAEYDWLFDDGRLIGGKPVPHVGWVFVPRVPVRGPLSRKVTRDAKRKDRPERADRSERSAPPVKASKEASKPMPVPAAPPPGARLPSKRRGRGEQPVKTETAVAAPAATAPTSTSSKSTHVPTPNKSAMVNELLPFLSFVELHPVGSPVEGVVESYASHGAYVTLGDARGYVPLRLMDEPAPRSAREVMKVGDTVALIVTAFHAQRRGIDLAVPSMAAVAAAEVTAAAAEAAEAAKAAKAAAPVKAGRKRAAKATSAPTAESPAVEVVAEPVAEAPVKRGRKKAAALAEPTIVEAPAVEAPAPRATAKRSATKRATPVAPAPEPVVEPAPAPVPAKRTRKAPAPAVVAPAAPVKKAAKAAKATKAAKAPAAPAKRVAKAPAPVAAPAKASRKKTAAPTT